MERLRSAQSALWFDAEKDADKAQLLYHRLKGDMERARADLKAAAARSLFARWRLRGHAGLLPSQMRFDVLLTHLVALRFFTHALALPETLQTRKVPAPPRPAPPRPWSHSRPAPPRPCRGPRAPACPAECARPDAGGARGTAGQVEHICAETFQHMHLKHSSLLRRQTVPPPPPSLLLPLPVSLLYTPSLPPSHTCRSLLRRQTVPTPARPAPRDLLRPFAPARRPACKRWSVCAESCCMHAGAQAAARQHRRRAYTVAARKRRRRAAPARARHPRRARADPRGAPRAERGRRGA